MENKEQKDANKMKEEGEERKKEKRQNQEKKFIEKARIDRKEEYAEINLER